MCVVSGSTAWTVSVPAVTARLGFSTAAALRCLRCGCSACRVAGARFAWSGGHDSRLFFGFPPPCSRRLSPVVSRGQGGGTLWGCVVTGLSESVRESIAVAGSRCETWMQFQAADLRDGYLADAADCAEEAAALSSLAFHLARGGLL